METDTESQPGKMEIGEQSQRELTKLAVLISVESEFELYDSSSSGHKAQFPVETCCLSNAM